LASGRAEWGNVEELLVVDEGNFSGPNLAMPPDGRAIVSYRDTVQFDPDSERWAELGGGASSLDLAAFDSNGNGVAVGFDRFSDEGPVYRIDHIDAEGGFEDTGFEFEGRPERLLVTPAGAALVVWLSSGPVRRLAAYDIEAEMWSELDLRRITGADTVEVLGVVYGTEPWLLWTPKYERSNTKLYVTRLAPDE
jgi:hypothetical protein